MRPKLSLVVFSLTVVLALTGFPSVANAQQPCPNVLHISAATLPISFTLPEGLTPQCLVVVVVGAAVTQAANVRFSEIPPSPEPDSDLGVVDNSNEAATVCLASDPNQRGQCRPNLSPGAIIKLVVESGASTCREVQVPLQSPIGPFTKLDVVFCSDGNPVPRPAKLPSDTIRIRLAP